MSRSRGRVAQVAAVGGRATFCLVTTLLLIVAVAFNPQMPAVVAGAFLLLFFLRLDRLH